MKGYQLHHFQPIASPIGQSQTQETVILLAAEQILAPTSAQNIKNEQNTIIRLATSIGKYGILEPLAVKLGVQSSGFPLYELIDGERRYRAAGIAGITKIPCVVLSPGDPKCLQMAEISRLKQENPHYFVWAEAILRLMNEYHMTQEEIARKIGLSQSAVANKLRLLKLSPEERRALCSSPLTERHARAILRISDPVRRLEIIHLAEKNSMTVAEIEDAIEEYQAKEQPKREIFAHKAPAWGIGSAAVPPTPLQGGKNSLVGAFNAVEGSRLGTQERGEREPKNAAASTRMATSGVVPRKFALRDLKPLYNSIERTLGIFEKTGVSAEYHKEEDESAARITIYIPKRG
ncbi:MAG: ParB/RepB/Spo0J family partition protein [Clostridia bacterium]|nr:ParB/RepB/Spo0J family partition protein [Clostridia bacterium]